MTKKWKSSVIFVVLMLFLAIAGLNRGPSYGEDELVGEWTSPDKSVKVSIYQGPPQDTVMVDYYVVGEIEFVEKKIFTKKMIYYNYHEEFEICCWEDNEKVVINGTVINVNDKKTWVID